MLPRYRLAIQLGSTRVPMLMPNAIDVVAADGNNWQ